MEWSKFGLYHLAGEERPYRTFDKLPAGWEHRVVPFGLNAIAEWYYYQKKHLCVGVSLADMEDGKTYLHVSVSIRHRLPTWDELKMVRGIFLGEDRETFIYFPPIKEYLNLCKNCLHLWSEEKEQENDKVSYN